MVLLLWAQTTPPIARDLRVGFSRSYRVRVEPDAGVPFDYRLSTKCEPLKKAGKALPDRRQLAIRLTDYRTTADGHTLKTAKLGGGELPIESTGLPDNLDIAGPMGRIWLPLLAWVLPPDLEAGKEFGFSPAAMGSGMSFGGTGLFHEPKKGRSQIDFHGQILRDGKPLGKVEMTIQIDAKAWPIEAEGSLVSADGTTHFTLKS